MRLATLEVNRTTPTPDPSPQGGGERTQRAAPFCVNPNGTRSSFALAKRRLARIPFGLI
jgi:hypothetical protein